MKTVEEIKKQVQDIGTQQDYIARIAEDLFRVIAGFELMQKPGFKIEIQSRPDTMGMTQVIKPSCSSFHDRVISQVQEAYLHEIRNLHSELLKNLQNLEKGYPSEGIDGAI